MLIFNCTKAAQVLAYGQETGVWDASEIEEDIFQRHLEHSEDIYFFRRSDRSLQAQLDLNRMFGKPIKFI